MPAVPQQELVVILTSFKDDAAKEIRSQIRCFNLQAPERADTSGLVKCLSKFLAPLGITDILSDQIFCTEGKPVLVGGGTDGASVNIA